MKNQNWRVFFVIEGQKLRINTIFILDLVAKSVQNNIIELLMRLKMNTS